jgi:Zn-dependent peptidase ImmA (M78 family)
MDAAVQIVAERLLNGVACPPTDLQAVAARLNVTEFCAEEMPISGELRRVGGALKLAYSCDLSPVRRNFTIAHELGHAVFLSTGPNCPRMGDELERLCDMLAAEILMPRAIFLAAAGPALTLLKLRELARTFATSLHAAALRCHELHRVSICEMDQRSVLWGYGIMRRSARAYEDAEIQDAISRALSGDSGDGVVFVRTQVWSGRCRLEWAPIARGTRALLLAQPLSLLP